MAKIITAVLLIVWGSIGFFEDMRPDQLHDWKIFGAIIVVTILWWIADSFHRIAEKVSK